MTQRGQTQKRLTSFQTDRRSGHNPRTRTTVASTSGFRLFLHARFLRTDITAKTSLHFTLTVETGCSHNSILSIPLLANACASFESNGRTNLRLTEETSHIIQSFPIRCANYGPQQMEIHHVDDYRYDKPASFLTLPSELRNIYDLVLLHQEPVRISAFNSWVPAHRWQKVRFISVAVQCGSSPNYWAYAESLKYHCAHKSLRN